MYALRTKLILTLILFFTALPILGQPRSDNRPFIINDTDIIDETETEKIPKELNPDEAKKNIEIGDYYYKKKDYVGAISRYLTAMEYQPDSTQAYKSVVKAHKSLVNVYESYDRTQDSLIDMESRYGKISRAIDAFSGFLSDNPDSKKCDDFRKMIAKLEAISPQSVNP